MKSLLETHTQLRDGFREYKQTHPKITFRRFLTDVLNYSQEESKKILKTNKITLYKK